MEDQMRRLQADIIVEYMLVVVFIVIVIVIVIVIDMEDQMRRSIAQYYISLLSGMRNIDDRDHLVGQLTR